MRMLKASRVALMMRRFSQLGTRSEGLRRPDSRRPRKARACQHLQNTTAWNDGAELRAPRAPHPFADCLPLVS
jgi:hypothetical protein